MIISLGDHSVVPLGSSGDEFIGYRLCRRPLAFDGWMLGSFDDPRLDVELQGIGFRAPGADLDSRARFRAAGRD